MRSNAHSYRNSWDAEDAVIRRCDAATADLGVQVQVRNQARVHLWYPHKHGVPCPPLVSSRAAIDTFLSRSSCFGIRAATDGALDVYAPFGLRRCVRHGRAAQPGAPAAVGLPREGWQQAWPELTVLPRQGKNVGQWLGPRR